VKKKMGKGCDGGGEESVERRRREGEWRRMIWVGATSDFVHTYTTRWGLSSQAGSGLVRVTEEFRMR
jgi:hypothetical protein